MLHPGLLLANALLVGALLAGCGQKGALYLPKPPPQSTTPEQPPLPEPQVSAPQQNPPSKP